MWEARKSNTKNNTPILITSNLKKNKKNDPILISNQFSASTPRDGH